MLKKIGKFLSSMPFAIVLLILLAAACAFSSTVTQGQDYNWYAARYGERGAGLILALQLDNAFHSWWFLGLSGILCLNLICCNLIRLPSLLKRIKGFTDPKQMLRGNNHSDASGNDDPEKVFRALRMPVSGKSSDLDGCPIMFAAGNLAGFWGAWICHLGILLLILGFALGQLTMEQYVVYALPGQTKPLGDTGLTVTVNDFRTIRTEQGNALQYTADLTVSDPEKGNSQNAEASVNAPAVLYGYKFFQNSFGWGADVRVLKNGAELQKELLCAGEFFSVQDKPELVIYFQSFYPDYVQTEGRKPATASQELNNPAYLYQVYYQRELLGMNVLMAGEELTIDEYTILFENPRNYTLLAVKKDRFTILALLGGTVTLAGLVMALYLRPRRLLALKEGNQWKLRAESVRGGVLFREQYEQALEEAGFTAADAETNAAEQKER